MNQVLQTILHRRSIRRFAPEQIPEEDLERILQAGLYAPSAGGRQGVLFAVCQDRAVNERLGKIKRANSRPRMAQGDRYVSREQPSIADDPAITDAFYGAPTVITLFAPKGFLFSPEDCAAAAENMLLAADSLGVGGCYIGQGWTAFRDPYGIRPICFGSNMQENGKLEYMVSSESVTMIGLGFKVERDLAPGEALWIDLKGNVSTRQCAENPILSPCAFEWVYFARPDSTMDGINVYAARLKLGEYLAETLKHEIDLSEIDVVMPIPDSSRPCAQQLAQVLNLPYREGFIKNRYVGRTFIMPGQAVRKKSVRQKLNAMPVEFEGKNVLLVDDSIVRGTTMREIVRIARESGAKKVFVASSAPRVMFPNVYGIDMPTRSELLCGDGRDAKAVAESLGADAVVYQTIDGLKNALHDLNPSIPRFDCSCFDGDYVTGDITEEYLARLDAARAKPAPQKDDAEEGEGTQPMC